MKSFENIQEVLDEEIDFLRKGKPTKVKIARANAVKGICNGKISQFKTKMEYCKLTGKVPKIPYLEEG